MQPQHAGEGAAERRFGRTRHTLQQHVSAGQQRHQQLVGNGLQPDHHLRNSLLSLLTKKPHLTGCISGKTGTHKNTFLLSADEVGCKRDPAIPIRIAGNAARSSEGCAGSAAGADFSNCVQLVLRYGGRHGRQTAAAA